MTSLRRADYIGRTVYILSDDPASNFIRVSFRPDLSAPGFVVPRWMLEGITWT